MIPQQTPLIPPHRQMIHQQRTRSLLIIAGTEVLGAAGVGLEDVGGVAVEVDDFAGYGADELGCVGGEGREGGGAAGLLDLQGC